MSNGSLKPCPFCGCDQIHGPEFREKWVVPYAFYCRNCRAYGPHKKTIKEADEGWSTRTPEPRKRDEDE